VDNASLQNQGFLRNPGHVRGPAQIVTTMQILFMLKKVVRYDMDAYCVTFDTQYRLINMLTSSFVISAYTTERGE